jgi:hypothetical protein
MTTLLLLIIHNQDSQIQNTTIKSNDKANKKANCVSTKQAHEKEKKQYHEAKLAIQNMALSEQETMEE